QLHDRARHRTHEIVNIQLYHFVAGPLAGIRDRDAYLCLTSDRNARRRDRRPAVSESRITQSITERKQRSLVGEQRTAPARGFLVVVDWKLAHRTRKTD